MSHLSNFCIPLQLKQWQRLRHIGLHREDLPALLQSALLRQTRLIGCCAAIAQTAAERLASIHTKSLFQHCTEILV